MREPCNVMERQSVPERRPTSPEDLSFTAVVCAYTLERWDDLQRALDSLLEQTRSADEVLLICDYNEELLARATAAFPMVRCLPNAGIHGLSGARNTGVRAATSEIVGFLDDDAAVSPDWVETMQSCYAETDVVGVAGHVSPRWRTARPAWFPDEFLWVVGCSYTGLPTGRAEVRNPIGASMSFRRDAVLAVGGFDTGLGRLGEDAAGCEETDLAIRIRRAIPGCRIILEPAARCTHVVNPVRASRQYFRRRCVGEGRSKAVLSSLAGPSDALSSERAYVLRTLPRGLRRAAYDVARGRWDGLSRGAAIVEGVLLTLGSYALAHWRRTHEVRHSSGIHESGISVTGFRRMGSSVMHPTSVPRRGFVNVRRRVMPARPPRSAVADGSAVERSV